MFLVDCVQHFLGLLFLHFYVSALKMVGHIPPFRNAELSPLRAGVNCDGICLQEKTRRKMILIVPQTNDVTFQNLPSGEDNSVL